ncbi:sugar ABC transporter ATP-binding protein [Saccharospirillum mangrovi]|uniref:sugar ABC transporter ATP-binding protein n=1 Tax=Saccharospirillum mangrovi TaxID=2161747 RepID=UPI000D3C36F8|nr:sugar ABC transporter ATP-binding protein [Saccharospirillum mangrovi]
MNPTLELSGVSKSFPGVKALTDISLSVGAGEIRALLGENGAGKSTLMKILSGIYQPDSGQIKVQGTVCHFKDYNSAISAGIGIIFQEFSLIPYLDAVDNIFLGRAICNKFGLLNYKAMRQRVEQIFASLNIDLQIDVPVYKLSVAEQQFVEIAKALSLNANILILDEPTATLTPNEADHLFAIMRELKKQGVTMIFISHHMEEIFEICDTVTVLRDGCYVGDMAVQDSTTDQLVEMMVGRKIENSFPPHTPIDYATTEKVLEVAAIQLTSNAPVNCFDLYKGEVLGFSGLVGSGRTETVMGLIGATKVHQKKVVVNGKPAKLKDPAEALRNGIGLLPESRKAQGLITAFAVRDNISINNLKKYTFPVGILDVEAERADSETLVRKLSIKTPNVDSVVVNLSGGNQQKIVIARWLNHQCNILIFDEPTRGIDVGAKAEIYNLIRELTALGFAVIMISSELPEVIGMSDRVAVFRQGKLVRTLSREEVSSNHIIKLATGGIEYDRAV